MRSLYLSLLFLFTNLIVYSQSKIESVGYSSVSVKPDVGILTLNFKTIRPEIQSAVETLNLVTGKATLQLSKLGLEDIDQTTRNFEVHVNQIYDKGNTRDSGFVASQQVEVKFKNSKLNVSKILGSFLDDYKGLNFNFTFQASDSLKHALEGRMIELATKDAIEKAELIAKSARLSLGRIKEIKHGNVEFYGVTQSGLSEVVYDKPYVEKLSGFDAKDIIFFDKVLVVFELK